MYMSVDEIMQLPRNEKLMLMEYLWSDLSSDKTGITSPAWHEKELLATEQRIAKGEEKILDWEEAKNKIRES